nr:unnamed protein product [Digitaria exilis]
MDTSPRMKGMVLKPPCFLCLCVSVSPSPCHWLLESSSAMDGSYAEVPPEMDWGDRSRRKLHFDISELTPPLHAADSLCAIAVGASTAMVDGTGDEKEQYKIVVAWTHAHRPTTTSAWLCIPAKAHHNNSSSASVPLEVDDHPRAGMSVTFEARQPGSRETFTLEPAFPSRSRLGKLELAGQARACHAGSNARDSATITTNHNDSPLWSKRKIHCATPPPILRRRHRSNPPGTVDSDLTLHRSVLAVILCQLLL